MSRRAATARTSIIAVALWSVAPRRRPGGRGRPGRAASGSRPGPGSGSRRRAPPGPRSAAARIVRTTTRWLATPRRTCLPSLCRGEQVLERGGERVSGPATSPSLIDARARAARSRSGPRHGRSATDLGGGDAARLDVEADTDVVLLDREHHCRRAPASHLPSASRPVAPYPRLMRDAYRTNAFRYQSIIWSPASSPTTPPSARNGPNGHRHLAGLRAPGEHDAQAHHRAGEDGDEERRAPPRGPGRGPSTAASLTSPMPIPRG